MKKISADQIEPGMVLAEDLIDMNGRTLLKKGAHISETIVPHFQKWGFTEIMIESEEEEDTGPPPVVGYQVFKRSWNSVEKEIDHKFELVIKEPHMLELKEFILNHFKTIRESYRGRSEED